MRHTGHYLKKETVCHQAVPDAHNKKEPQDFRRLKRISPTAVREASTTKCCDQLQSAIFLQDAEQSHMEIIEALQHCAGSAQ